MILAAIAVGLALRQQLLFYPDRPEAQRAATKFAPVWHTGDAMLVLAAGLLFARFGTLDVTALGLAAAATDGLGLVGTLGVAAIVAAAALKTAAFPLHGWLTEVMEAPTPVSALLHAGIINSGGVLLITAAPLVQASTGAMAALVVIGGFTALFGAAVMLTQSAIKTALAWSTISQMGFMLLQCGLGLWTLALLHIIAHSLYKAHAFLSSGNAVAEVANIRRPGPVAAPNVAAVLKSFALSLAIFAAIAGSFTALLGPKSLQALALGAILIFGVAYLVAQGLADRAPAQLTKRTGAAAIAAAIGYFSFQAIAEKIWGPILPTAPMPDAREWAMIVIAVASFGLVAFAQALFPLWAHHQHGRSVQGSGRPHRCLLEARVGPIPAGGGLLLRLCRGDGAGLCGQAGEVGAWPRQRGRARTCARSDRRPQRRGQGRYRRGGAQSDEPDARPRRDRAAARPRRHRHQQPA